MRKQNIPNVNDDQILEKIVSAKQGSRNVRLSNIKGRVKEAYASYVVNSITLGVMEPAKLGKIQKNDMEHCYSSSTVGLSALKTAIKANHGILDRELCPYCSIREPSEFDHYLPKSKFQEFAVFSKNLIWTCHQCNHKKREHFSQTNRYLNTYYDVIPEAQFLFCRIGLPIESEGVSFYFKKPDGITLRQHQDIVSHAKKLNLLETYEHLAAQKLPIWLKKWQFLAEDCNKEELKSHLTLDMNAEIRGDLDKYGKNHYKYALKVSVLKSIDEIVETLYN
ncbi:MAG TPA: hypothetical protein DCR48_12385 [Flavobacteriales bacterium]|nr:hypothetical protein [Flavobacteriales bacterium]